MAAREVYEFGEFALDASGRRLSRAGHNLSLAPKAFDLLLALVRHASELGLAMKQKALERDPNSPLVYLQISMSYWHQRRYDVSIDWATKALALDPRHPHAREHLA